MAEDNDWADTVRSGFAYDVACFIGDPKDANFNVKLGYYLAHISFEMSLARVAQGRAVSRDAVRAACCEIEDRRHDPKVDALIAKAEALLIDIIPLQRGFGGLRSATAQAAEGPPPLSRQRPGMVQAKVISK